MNLLTIVTILGIILILAFLFYVFFDIRNLLKKKISIEEKEVVNNECPDFFELDNTKEHYCKNTYNLGSGEDFDGSDTVYKDFTKSDEAKCNWARRNHVSWEGLDRLC